MTPRVTDVDTVEVGKFYMVPCGLVDWFDGHGRRSRWIPLLGPAHEDAEIIRVPQRHYHYDWRFITMATMRLRTPFMQEPLGQIELTERVGEVAWKRRKCIHPMPIFPLKGPWHGELETAYAAVRLKPDCRTCPHRGVPLNGMPVVDGATICAGHGLAWNLETGEMVRRVKRTALRVET